VTEAVLDASVVLKWFVTTEARGRQEARGLRDAYRAGELIVAVPSLLFLELLNVAGRRWGWDEGALLDLAAALQDLRFEVAEPELASVAAWVGRGLTAYDAAYVALAEDRGTPLVSDDETILEVAPDIARPLIHLE
jgi:predicted nucleic acid-binding protein